MTEGLWTRLANLLGADRYNQHAICLSQDEALLFLFTAFHLATFVSYMVIGGMLIWHRGDLVRFMRFLYLRPAALTLFGCFIASCGLGHLTMVLTLYVGVYFLDVLINGVTAAVSAGTALMTVQAFYTGEQELPSIADTLAGRSRGEG